MFVTFRLKCHLRQNADAQAQFDVSLDYVRIDRRQHHVRDQPFASNAWLIFERPVNAKS